jgi:TonB family protein
MIVEALRTLALSTLASSAAILVILLLRKPLRHRFGAQVAYALWALVPFAALVALLPAPIAAVAPTPAIVAAAPAPMQALTSTITVARGFDPMPWFALVWLLGAIGCASLFVRQQRHFVRSLGYLSTCDDGIAQAQTTAGCPALVGAWRPRIVLPADFERRYDNAERELILAHERAHRARGDAQANAFAAVLRCLYWFNPLFHFAASRLRFDQELACDAIVISRFPEARRPYADAMLKTQLADLGLPAGCHWQSSHPLKERIAMLKQSLPGRAQRRFGIACVAAIVVAVSFASWAAQPSVPADATQESIPVKPASAPTGAVSPRITEVSYRRLTRIVYPQSAIAANAQGVVYVAVHVGTDGKVASAKVDGDMPMGRTDLADAALAAVKNWTFEPRKVDGKPVPSDTIVSVAFSLDPNKPLAIEPGILDAIRVSPPLAEAATPAESVPASENVEYRLMHPPHYPASAVKAKVQGDVVLKVHVDAQGNPVEAGVAKTIPPGLSPELGNASIAAVMQWKFNPARKHGKAVDDWVSVPITFSLTEM